MGNHANTQDGEARQVSAPVAEVRPTPDCPDSGTPAGAVTFDGARSAHALRGLTIVLPCFDEAEYVDDAIRNATRAAQRCATQHEIVVVDDGSSDETAAIAARVVQRDRRVRLVLHTRHLGYGGALRSGIAAASMPWILLTDPGLRFDVGDLESFLPGTDDCDLVIGWRIMRSDPLNRRVSAAAWNWLVHRMFGLRVRDVDCAFKLIRRDLLQSCDLTSTGATISTELLVKCLAAGGRLEEVGVHHRARIDGAQSGAGPRMAARTFRELTALRRTMRAAAGPVGA